VEKIIINERPKHLDYTPVSKTKSFLLIIYIFICFYEQYINNIIGPNTKYYILIVAIAFLFGYRNIKFMTIHWLMISWLIFKIISVFWAFKIDYSSNNFSSHLLSQIGMIGLFVVLTIVKFDYKFVKKIIDVSLYASISLGLLSLLFSEAYLGIESRQVLTILGIQLDPNNLAAFHLIGISIALYYIIFEKKNIMRNIVFVGINIFAVMITGSRGGLFSLLVIIICFIIFNDTKEKKGGRLLKKLCFIAILSIIIYLILKNFLPNATYTRLFDFESYKGGSDRDKLWESAIFLIKQKPFFGWGWGGYDSGIHNTYLSMLCDIGILGTLLFLISLFIICYESVKSKNSLVIILLITGLSPSFFIDAINKRFFWNAIIICVMILNSKKQKIQ